jgi:hypothetical protein
VMQSREYVDRQRATGATATGAVGRRGACAAGVAEERVSLGVKDARLAALSIFSTWDGWD